MVEARDLLKFEDKERMKKLLEIFRRGGFSEESKLKLHYFIKNLTRGTNNQKEKFMSYYNLMPGSNKAKSYEEIGREYNCSGECVNATVRQYLIYFKNKQTEEEKIEFEKIINTITYKNGRKLNLNNL